MRLAIILILLASLAGCGQKQSSADKIRNTTVKELGFAFNLPDGWIGGREDDSGDCDYAGNLPDVGKMSSKRFELNVRADSETKGFDLEGLMKRTCQMYSRMPGYQERQARIIKHKSGQQTYLIEADVNVDALDWYNGASSEGPHPDGPHRLKLIGFLDNGRELLVRILVPIENCDHWMAEFDPILDSFITMKPTGRRHW